MAIFKKHGNDNKKSGKSFDDRMRLIELVVLCLFGLLGFYIQQTIHKSAQNENMGRMLINIINSNDTKNYKLRKKAIQYIKNENIFPDEFSKIFLNDLILADIQKDDIYISKIKNFINNNENNLNEVESYIINNELILNYQHINDLLVRFNSFEARAIIVEKVIENGE